MNIPLITLLLLVVTGVEAAEWMVSYRDEKYPGKCVIYDDLILNEGSIIKDPTKDCLQIVCGTNGLTIFQSCGSFTGLPMGCKFGKFVDTNQPYPQCCERKIICN